MRKLIAFGFLILTIALLFGQGLHKIPKNTKIEGWLSVRGDIYAPWHLKYDIGKRAYWYDSMFLAYSELRTAIIWSTDSVDTTFLTPTKVQSGFGLFDTCSALFIFKEGHHLNADSIVIGSDTFPSPGTGWGFIDTSGGDTLKFYLNGGWEVK